MLDSPVNEMPTPNVMEHHIPTSKGHQLKKLYLGWPQNSIVLIYFTQWRTYICWSTVQSKQGTTESISILVLSQMSQHCKVSHFDSGGCSHASAVDSPKYGHKGGQLGLFGTRPSFVFQPNVSYLCFCKTPKNITAVSCWN